MYDDFFTARLKILPAMHDVMSWQWRRHDAASRMIRAGTRRYFDNIA